MIAFHKPYEFFKFSFYSCFQIISLQVLIEQPDFESLFFPFIVFFGYRIHLIPISSLKVTLFRCFSDCILSVLLYFLNTCFRLLGNHYACLWGALLHFLDGCLFYAQDIHVLCMYKSVLSQRTASIFFIRNVIHPHWDRVSPWFTK